MNMQDVDRILEQERVFASIKKEHSSVEISSLEHNMNGSTTIYYWFNGQLLHQIFYFFGDDDAIWEVKSNPRDCVGGYYEEIINID